MNRGAFLVSPGWSRWTCRLRRASWNMWLWIKWGSKRKGGRGLMKLTFYLVLILSNNRRGHKTLLNHTDRFKGLIAASFLFISMTIWKQNLAARSGTFLPAESALYVRVLDYRNLAGSAFFIRRVHFGTFCCTAIHLFRALKRSHDTWWMCRRVKLFSLPQVCLWEGDQEEEVSFWAPGPSPAPADVWFVAPHHRPTYQHHAQKKVRVRTASLLSALLRTPQGTESLHMNN